VFCGKKKEDGAVEPKKKKIPSRTGSKMGGVFGLDSFP